MLNGWLHSLSNMVQSQIPAIWRIIDCLTSSFRLIPVKILQEDTVNICLY